MIPPNPINFGHLTMREYYVYILTNPSKQVFYTGMTNDLAQRVTEHYLNRGKPKTFAGRYFCYQLVYWEIFSSPSRALAREKEIKGWARQKKLNLIKNENPSLGFLNGTIISPWPPQEAYSRGEIG